MMWKAAVLMMGGMLLLAACGASASEIAMAELPDEGDPERGQTLFAGDEGGITPCSSCHLLDGENKDLASPSLLGFSEVAAERVAGQTAREYAFWSITEPGRYIVEGFGNAMPADYDNKLSPQDIADLIAFLLTL